MILVAIGILLLTACALGVTATGFFVMKAIKSPYAYERENAIVIGIGGFLLLILGLFIIAFMTGEITVEQSIPDGCYRIYNESDTSFIPTGNGGITPIATGERHYLPIRCP